MPLKEFTTMLRRGIQDVDRKTPHLNILKLKTGKFSSSEDISSHDVLIIGHVIVNIGDITSNYWPQVQTNYIFPENR